jgi:hypothetical protein
MFPRLRPSTCQPHVERTPFAGEQCNRRARTRRRPAALRCKEPHHPPIEHPAAAGLRSSTHVLSTRRQQKRSKKSPRMCVVVVPAPPQPLRTNSIATTSVVHRSAEAVVSCRQHSILLPPDCAVGPTIAKPLERLASRHILTTRHHCGRHKKLSTT